MNSRTRETASILACFAAGVLMGACSHDRSGDGRKPSLLAENGQAVPASLDVTSTQPAASVPVTTPPVDPATAKASKTDGTRKLDSGDYAGAVGSLATAVSGRPDDPSARYLLGIARWKSGDPKGAESDLVESAKLDGGRLKIWINLSRIRHELSDRKGALEAAEKAIEIDPTSADAVHQKGRALMELGRKDEALDALKTAHDLDPDNGYIANSLGLLLIQTGKPGDAVAPLEIAKTKLPHVAYVRNNLAVAYERTGRLDEAKVEYQAALDAGDSHGKAMSSLVRLGATDTTDTSVVTAASSAGDGKQ